MKIYRDNGGKAGVGVDTERWDTAQDPAAGEAQLSSEDEKKVCVVATVLHELLSFMNKSLIPRLLVLLLPSASPILACAAANPLMFSPPPSVMVAIVQD